MKTIQYPLPNGGGPQGKKWPDTRMGANTYCIIDHVSFSYYWKLSHNGRILAEGRYPYSRHDSAKRGLIRFLKRLGVDESAVRWEA